MEGVNEIYMHKYQTYLLCRKHKYRYVEIRMTDGQVYDGVLADVDNENVYLAVPHTASHRESTASTVTNVSDQRQLPFPGYGFGYPGFGYPGFGYPVYGYPGFYPGARFRRLVLPLALIAALSLLPYF